MKPHLLKISHPADYSYNLFEQVCPYFATPWHYHPEIEIVLVLESTGQKYVGSSITDFYPGDLVMIGPYLPHYYRNDEPYLQNNKDLKARSIVIHFNEDFLGEKFLSLPESANIKSLLDKSKRGILFGREITENIKERLINLPKLEGMERLIAFLKILRLLSETKDLETLTTDVIQIRNEIDSDRIKRVLEFVTENFQNDIKLDQVASLAYMSESAFSRYFKKRTRKTFSNFLSEIRIEHACKLLQNDKMSVSEISFESGFNNLSNFNRQFKAFKKTTPLAFRMKYLD
jgi:AraC-like DNA-binding protein